MPTIEVMGNRSNKDDGLGRLGQALVDYEHHIPDLEVAAVDLPSNADVLVYCRRSDGTLDEAIQYCTEKEVPLMFLSSGIDLSGRDLDAPEFPMVRVPNAALGVVNYMRGIERKARGEFADWSAHITEHHQEAKKDTSGTAKKLADMLGLDYSEIESVRDFELSSEKYGIPESSRDGYAVHSVTFTSPITGEVSDAFEVVVRGREVYAQGVIDIYRAIREAPEAFYRANHDIVELVKRGIIVATELRSREELSNS